MTTVRKSGSKGHEEPKTPDEEKAKVDAFRTAIGPLSGRAAQYCSDACLSRYLRARNWNSKKAEKMLRESLKWRESYKPESIRWEDVAGESETGKVYRSSFHDKQGRTVLVMRPGNQNTNSHEGQIKQLVYCLENAILNLPEGREQMVWLIDFKGWTVKTTTPMKTTRETAHILQNHYPERLAIAVLYNPPRIFEAFWAIVKPFLDPKTFRKVKFVYTKNPESQKLLDDLIDADKLEAAFGGTNTATYVHSEYAKLMQEDDVKTALYWKLGSPAAQELPANGDSKSDTAARDGQSVGVLKPAEHDVGVSVTA